MAIHMMRTLTLLCLFSSCYRIFGIGPKQTAGVVGRLLCNGKRAAGVKIKLYEKGSIDKLAEVKTDHSGSFKIPGTATESSKSDLQLNIYHRCNFKRMFCYKTSIGIPSKYISNGKLVMQYFDIGTLELSMLNKRQEKMAACTY